MNLLFNVLHRIADMLLLTKLPRSYRLRYPKVIEGLKREFPDALPSIVEIADALPPKGMVTKALAS